MSDHPIEEYRLDYASNPTTVVRFVLAGDDLRPSEITQLLGTAPDRAWAKGDEIPADATQASFISRRKRHIGYWSTVPDCSKYELFEHQLRQLIEAIERFPPVVKELIENFNGEISVGYSSAETNIGFFFEKDMLRRIHDLGLAINLDIYPVVAEASFQ